MKRARNMTVKRSKNEKNDEHYTQLADIKNEARHRRSQFNGMSISEDCQMLYAGCNRHKSG